MPMIFEGSGMADKAVSAVTDAFVHDVSFNTDPFKDSRGNLDQWLGSANAPTAVLSPGAPGRATHHFFVGDDQADRRAFDAGLVPHGANWLKLAKSQLGTPYVWDTSQPGVGYDCSGFSQWLVKRVTGVQLDHHAASQAQQTRAVGKDELQPGDLLFFRYGRLGSEIDHVEVYMGNGKMIGTANPTEDLDIDNVDWAHFVQGGRVPGMSGAATGTGGPRGNRRRRRGAAAAQPSQAPLTVPFAVGPNNYFAGILQPMLTHDAAKPLPSEGGKWQMSGTASPEELQRAARRLVLQRGWSVNDYQALVKLWNRESGWNPSAVNDSSGATGIPQLNPQSHDIPRGWNDPMTQIQWGLRYIAQRYGSPSAAWAHSEQTGWY